ncbi:hypothetical protein [Paracoccus cavernae]|uniref:hypothetical protein n=1 Tax=Paracoccus cavernae TaxID=1571207 RepID=UPI0035F23B56
MKLLASPLVKPALLALLVAAPLPLFAQAYEPPAADQDSAGNGSDEGDREIGKTFERGLNSLFEDLLRDIEPHMEAIGRDLGAKVNEFAPVFDDLGAMMDDIGNYQAPERLANGDILIRRKPDAPPPPPLSDKFQELTRPSPDMDPRLAPERGPDPWRNAPEPAPAVPQGQGGQIDL